MRAFVTGGTGFVGSHLVDALLAEGHEAVCLVRNPAKADRVFGDRRPEIVPGDLNDAAAMARGAAGADIVFHVAALIAARNRAEFFAVNEGATQRLLDVVRERRALRRFVYVSSLAAAGPSARGRPRAEHEPEAPVTYYGASKLAAERAVRASGLPWTIVRPPTVYGPRDTELLRLFQTARFGIGPVFGDGGQELSLIFAPDLARALLAAPETPAGHLYHVTHPAIVTAADVVTALHRAVRPDASRGMHVLRIPGPMARGVLRVTELAARLTGRPTLLSRDKANEFFAPAWTCTAAAFERATGWRAEHDLDQGLRRTAAWYRQHGWL